MSDKFITETDKENVILNLTDGSIRDLKKHIKLNQEDFIMVFLNTIPDIANKLERNEMRLLMYIWKLSNYNPNSSDEGNIIVNNPYFKKKIKEYGCDMSNNAINVYFNRLCSKDFIKRLNTGTYILNPKYFYKGTLTSRSHLMFIMESENNLK